MSQKSLEEGEDPIHVDLRRKVNSSYGISTRVMLDCCCDFFCENCERRIPQNKKYKCVKERGERVHQNFCSEICVRIYYNI
jgi:hypothetical protein